MDHPAEVNLGGLVLCVLLALLTLASAAALVLHSRREQTHTLRWFRLSSTPQHFWQGAETRTIDRHALLAPLRLEDSDPAPLFWRHSSVSSFIIGVPERVSSALVFAAAACGVMAREFHEIPDSSETLRLLPEKLTIPASPEWSIGLLPSGDVLSLNCLPGSTVAVCAQQSVLHHVTREIRWYREDFSIISATHSVPVHEAWKAAWDPASVRVVLCPLSADATSSLLSRDTLTASDVLEVAKARVMADIVLLMGSDGSAQLLHREYRRSFSAVTPRPNARPVSSKLEPPAHHPPGNPPSRGLSRFLAPRARSNSAAFPATGRQ